MRFFGELSGSPFFVALCCVFYFQCTEKDGTVGARKEATVHGEFKAWKR
jgi:hypothetical protein